jgi:uncharacterized coiled-coil protein SlyX
MKSFELSSKKRKDGKRRFTALLYKLQPPESVVNNVGTDGHWNENGITFIEEYAAQNLESIKDMSMTCDFIDADKTEVSGHGETGEITDDGLPKFEADIIGHFTEGFIAEFDDNGTTSKAVFGKGVIDEMRHADFVAQIETNMANGIAPSGSIEILHPEDSDSIIYLNGKFEQGRVPVKYVHSGFSLVSNPADKASKMIELNNKRESEDETMDEKTINLICDSVKNAVSETNSKNSEYETKIAELNASIAEKDNQISELNASIAKKDNQISELNAEKEKWVSEKTDYEKALGEAKAKEKLAELNSAIEGFTDEQKAFAKDEIEAFKADPMNGEINSITDKIYREIGRTALESAKVVETNSVDDTTDIFGEINSTNANTDGEDIDIFATVL